MRRTSLLLIGFLSAAVQASSIELIRSCANEVPAWPTADQVCAPQPLAENADLARGLSRRTTWLELELAAAGDGPADQILSIGHPRLSQVSVWHGDQPVQRGGMDIARHQRPIDAAQIAFAVTLDRAAPSTVRVAIWSETYVDATPRLRDVDAFYRQQSQTDFFNAIALGGLLLAALVSLMLSGATRLAAYRHLGLTLLGLFLHFGFQTGLLVTYLWPAQQPFFTPAIGLSTGLALVFFVTFTQAFFTRQAMGQWLRRLAQITAAATLLAIAYGALVDFSTTVLAWSLGTYLSLTLCMLGLIDASIRGSRPARAIALGCALMFAMESVKLLTIIGQQQFSSALGLMGPWTVVLTASFIIVMVGVAMKSNERALRHQIMVNQSRERFLNEMNHEIRAPIARIIDLAATITPDDLKSQIIAHSRGLLGMVDRALSSEQVRVGERRESTQTVVSWSDWIARLDQHVTGLGQSLFPAHHNRVTFSHGGDAAAHLWIDQFRCHQLIENLVGNALAYNRNADVVVQIHSARLPGSSRYQVEICVHDNGIGIPANELELATAPLFRGRHALQTQPDGSGMGLAIVAQIAAELNGQFTLSGDHGVKAQVSLIVESAEAERAGAPSALSGDQHRALSALVSTGAMNDIVEFADDIQDQHPELAEQLRAAVDDMDLAGLVKLVQA